MNKNNFKRITLLCGHYGSGKTNIAVNMALKVKEQQDNVAIADLDIVNPYFRAKDSQNDFKKAGIKLFCSEYANSNVDIPALPQEIYTITADKSLSVIIDVGGDDRGALALGRIVDEIIAEDNYDMFLVINKFRPLTPDAKSVKEVADEIFAACRLPFTAIVNNSNLGELTTANDVLESQDFANEVSILCNLPVAMTTVSEKLYDELKDKIPNLFPLKLQAKPV